MADVTISVIGKDMLSASFGAMRTTVASLSSAILSLSERAISPVTIALGNLFSDVVKNGVNALNNLKGTIESFSFIRLNMEMEMTRSSFTTLLKSGDEANKMLETLRQYANFTPFEFGQLTAATKKMLAFGFSAKEITTDFMGIGAGLLDVVGNAASALGAGQEGIDRITRALGQMRGLARVSAEDMNQLIDVGVQGYQILAEQLGMTVKEVRDAMKQGAIDAETGIKALLQGMMQQYGGGMESFSQTAEGMSSTLNDYIKDIQRTFGEVAYKEYRLLLTEVNKLVSSPAFVKFAAMLGVQFGGAIKRLNEQILFPAIQRLTAFVNQLGASDAAMQAFFDNMMKRLYPFAALLREMGNALKTVISITMQFTKAFVQTSDAQQAISWLARQLAKATEIFYDFATNTRISSSAMSAFAERVVAALRPGAVALVRFTPVLQEFVRILITIGKEVFRLNTTQSIIRTLINIYVNLADTFTNLVPRLAAFREAIPSLMKNLVDSLAPVRNVLSGFIDVLMSSARFISVFIREFLGMKQVKELIANIPSLLNEFADTLRYVATRIDALTLRLPAFFDFLENLPTLIRTTIQSFLPLSNLIDQVKTYLGGLIQQAVQFVVKFTLVGKIINTVYEVFKRVSSVLQPFINFFGDMIRALLTALGVSMDTRSFFDILASGVLALLNAVIRALPTFDQMLTFFTAVVSIVRAGIPLVIQLFREVIGIIGNLGSQVVSQLPTIQNIISTVISVISRAINELISLLPAAVQTISAVLSALLPIINSAISSLKEMITFALRLAQVLASNLTPYVDALRKTFAPASQAFRDFTQTLLPLIDALLQATTAFANFSAPFVGSALASLLNWLTQTNIALTQFLLTVRDALNSGDFSALTGMFRSFSENIVSRLQETVGSLLTPENVVYALVTGKARLLNFIITTLTDLFINAINYVKENLPTWIQNGSAYLKELVPLLMQSLTESWNTLSGTLSLSADGIVNALSGLWQTVMNIARAESQNIAITVGDIPNMIANKLSENFLTSSGRAEFIRYFSLFMEEARAFSANFIDSAYEMMGNFVGSVSKFFTGPELSNAFTTLRIRLGDAAEEIGFRIAIIAADLIKTMIANSKVNFENFVMLILNEGPSLLAAIMSVFVQIEATLRATVLRAIQGLITGILTAFGLTDWIPAINKFFDEMVRDIEMSASAITNALNGFANWWRGLELGTMLRDFTRFVQDYAVTIFPRIVQILAQMPTLLVNMASVSIKTALRDMVTTLQNAITSITDSMGLSPVSDYVRRTFQIIRDSINGLGGPIQQQVDWLRQFNDYIRETGQQSQQLLTQFGFSNAGATRAVTTSIANSAQTIARATSVVNDSDLGQFAQNLSSAQSSMRNSLSQIASTLSGDAVSLFTPVGIRIAQGILEGFLAALPSIESHMKNALSSLSSQLSMSASTTTSQGVSAINTVNNKNVNLSVTINQSTPTNVVENLRYAQALATSRIY